MYSPELAVCRKSAKLNHCLTKVPNGSWTPLQLKATRIGNSGSKKVTRAREPGIISKRPNKNFTTRCKD